MSFGAVVEQYVERYLTFDDLLDLKNPGTFVLRSEGEAMNPRIMNGDFLIVHRGVKPIQGAIIVALVNNQFTVRRFFQRSANVILAADNKKFSDLVLNDDSGFEVWGVVAFVLGKL